MIKPSYLTLLENGKLKLRVEKLNKILECCVLCPRRCKANRLKGEVGYCNTADNPLVSSYQRHFGEEKELVGQGGSGTIFFSNCNLRCVFCQNYQISQLGEGKEIDVVELSNIMLYMQKQGCHNISLVSPSHVVPQIVEAIYIASQKGLSIPIVYNTNGYDSLETLRLLDGIVDIYLPDIKFSSESTSHKYIDAKEYYSIATAAIKEMYRQVGNLKTTKTGVAYRGLLIRHLVMPENLAGTDKIMKFIADEISEDAYVNIMAQYYPTHRAYEFEHIDRSLSVDEYTKAVEFAKLAGLKNYRTARFFLESINY